MIALCYHVNQKYSVNCLVVSVLSEVAKCLLYNLIAVSGLFLFVMVMEFFQDHQGKPGEVRKFETSNRLFQKVTKCEVTR